MPNAGRLAAWDPEQYLRFASERFRPFFELLAQIGAESPAAVTDLGCGTGELTWELKRRWPEADVLGIDNSPEMLAAARRLVGPDSGRPDDPGPGTPPRFILGDLRTWRPREPVDVIIANAVLQWIPGYQRLIERWVGWLPSGGWLAFQVPANLDQPSQRILRELVRSPEWCAELTGVLLARQAADPAEFIDQLSRLGCAVDAWETTYLPVLRGPNPVVEWYRGSGLRPVLAALTPERAEAFLAEYTERVRDAYPARPYGTVMPFRRVFVAARRG